MKILVTGANGFVGKNLIETLKSIRDGKDKTTGLDTDIEIFAYDIGTSQEEFQKYCAECDFVFNLVGVHRPKDDCEFMKGNFGFLSELLETLQKYNNNCPVMFSSSIQAEFKNPYGESKRAAEQALFSYSEKTGARVCVYRFSNLFGKWSKPNYNSAVATFCYNIARDLPIMVRDRNYELNLIYIDDAVAQLLSCLKGEEMRDGKFCVVPVSHKVTLGEIADLIYSFNESRKNLSVPNVTEGSFSKKLYSTYLSFLPEDKFAYPLKMNVDNRGAFTEIIRTASNGQFSVNISKPGITKGQHWHHTKNEKFLVVSGTGVIRFRRIDSNKPIEYFVSGNKLEVVDIPTGYTHNIENLGDTDLVTFMWCNECFNPDHPDTYSLPVTLPQKQSGNKILVLGGAGMAGHVISTYFKECGYDVTVFDTHHLDGLHCIVGSAFNTELLKGVLLSSHYIAVINCIGLLNKACDSDVHSAIFLNSYLPHLLSDTYKDSDTKVIHISSDCVFSGKDAPYKEDDVSDATDCYGRTKAFGEISTGNDLTFRTSIIGPDISKEKNGLVNWFMKQNEKVTGYSKSMWSGVSTITLARAMRKAIECDISGVYHLVNNEYISKYDLLKLFNDTIKKAKISVAEDDSVVSKKVLVNTRHDFDFAIGSYKDMVFEIKDWIELHSDLYSHYGE